MAPDPRPPDPTRGVPRTRATVLLVTVGAVVLLRLLEMRSGASPDEGGFLVVGSQWHSGGSSLYGSYWVDRPPLLVTVFSLAHALGGLLALRLLGILASVLVVWLLFSTSRRVFGDRAAGWTAVVAGALLVSPLYGAVDVNGELLALPLVALGLRLAVEAVLAEDALVARGAALGAGVAAVGAVLVKQNLADVAVFAAVCWILAWRTGRIDVRRLAGLVGLAALGAVLAYSVVMLWALAHGTSPAAAYEATYPFRIKAGHALAQESRVESGTRLVNLGGAFVGSAVPLLLAAAAALAVRRARDAAVVWGLAAVLAFGTFSVLAGGSYWLHYLLETVPAVALAAGALATAAPRAARLLVGLVALSGVVAAGVVVVHPTPTPGTTIGRAIAAVAQPGDTVVSAFGDADIVRVSGMSSPYEYLWTLPAQVRDPDLRELRGVLAGATAPDWFVVRDSRVRERLARLGPLQVLDQRYRVVGTVCGRRIYLRNDVQRSAPERLGGDRCGAPTT